MKNTIIRVFFIIVMLSSVNEIYAQNLLTEKKSCRPSAEEILSIIKTTFGASPPSNGVLIAGEIGGRRFGFSDFAKPLHFTHAIKWIGGIKKTGSGLIYVIRQIDKDKPMSLVETDIKIENQKYPKDLLLENGDVVFVPRPCRGGEFLPPTFKKPQIFYNLPRVVDPKVALRKHSAASSEV